MNRICFHFLFSFYYLEPVVTDANLELESNMENLGIRIKDLCSADAGRILAAGEKRAIHVNVENGEIENSYKYGKQVNCICITPNQQMILTGCSGALLHARTFPAGDTVAKFKTELKGKTKTLALKATDCIACNNNYVFAGGNVNFCMGFDLNNLEKTTPSKRYKHGAKVSALAVYGNHLFTGGMRGRTIMWNIETEERVRAFRLNQPVKTIRLLSKGDALFIGYTSGIITYWSVKSGNSIKRWDLLSDLDTMFVADRHSHLIFNTGRQITIMTAETSTVQKVIELEDNGRKGVMTSDGGLYCVTQGNGICAFRASGFTTKELDPTEHSV